MSSPSTLIVPPFIKWLTPIIFSFLLWQLKDHIVISNDTAVNKSEVTDLRHSLDEQKEALKSRLDDAVSRKGEFLDLKESLKNTVTKDDFKAFMELEKERHDSEQQQLDTMSTKFDLILGATPKRKFPLITQ